MKEKIVRINMTNYDLNEWSLGDIIANEIRQTFGLGIKIGDIHILGLGKFIDDSYQILRKQQRKLNKKRVVNKNTEKNKK